MSTKKEERIAELQKIANKTIDKNKVIFDRLAEI